MSWKGLEGEDLVQNLRQLVISFEPQIREAGTVDQSEEALYHLEENDEHFHRSDMIFVISKTLIMLTFVPSFTLLTYTNGNDGRKWVVIPGPYCKTFVIYLYTSA